MLTLRFMRPLLTAFVLCCSPALVFAQEYSAGKGEIRFDGTFVSFDEVEKTLVINVSSFTLPNGKSSKLEKAKPKTIAIQTATKLEVKGLPEAEIAPFLQVGARIVVIGKDVGAAKVDVPARLVLIIPPATALAPVEGSTPFAGEGDELALTEPGEPILQAGESRYEGTITGILSPEIFTASISLQVNDKGENAELAQLRSKSVEMNAETVLRSRSNAEQKLKLEDLKVGQRVTIVGNSGGRIVRAREVALWIEDVGKTRYHGSVNVSREVATLSDKGDEAREARIFEEALKLYNRALQAAQGNDDLDGQGFVHARLGLTYEQMGQNKNAMESFQSSLAIWKRTGNTANQGTALINISRLYAAAKDAKKARATVDEAIVALEDGGNSPVLAIAYGLRGQIQADAEQVSQALESWQRALSISRELKEKDDERTWLGQIAVAYAELNQKAKSLETIAEVEVLIAQTQDKSEQAASYYWIAIAYHSLNDTAKALENMKRAATLYGESEQRESASEAAKLIEEWARPQEQPEPVPDREDEPRLLPREEIADGAIAA